jgi:hypothetical protein
MSRIGYVYGSEWHLLWYLGYRRAALSRAVSEITGATTVEWIDAPLLPSGQVSEWEGIDVLAPSPGVQQQWHAFWPTRGSAQRWDAIARLDGTDWLLVEAKAHPNELLAPCQAKAPASIAQIDRAFDATRQAVGADAVPSAEWRGPYYQYANRLATLHFLRTVCDPPVPARLLFIYFCGDRHPRINGPADAAGWAPPLNLMYHNLGIDPQAPLLRFVHALFLDVAPRR